MSLADRTLPGPAAAAPLPPADDGPGLVAREREALRTLTRLVAERAEAERRVEADRAAAVARAERDYREGARALAARFDETEAADRAADEARRRAVVDDAMAGEAQAKHDFARNSRKIAAEFDSLRELTRNEHNRAKAAAAAAFEAAEKAAAAAYAAERAPADKAARLAESMKARLVGRFAAYKKFGLAEAVVRPSRGSFAGVDDPVHALYDRLVKAEPDLALLEGLIIPKAMTGYRFLWLFVGVFLALVVPLASWQGPAVGAGLAVLGAAAGGAALRSWLYALSKSQVTRLHGPLAQAMADADALAAHARAKAENRLKDARAAAAAKRDDELLRARNAAGRAVQVGEATRDERLRQINEVYARKMVEIQTAQAVAMREAVDLGEARVRDVSAQRASALRALDEAYRAAKARVSARHEAAFREALDRWRGGVAAVAAEVAAVAAAADAAGPAWDDPSWPDRPPPASTPPALRFGASRVALADLPGGFPADPRWAEGIPPSLEFPALLPFPDGANLLIEAPPAGRAAALGALQAAMFRLLTGLPPGQVRFTIIDPIGIGRNFGAFLHLADYDEALVTGQVWSDPRQVAERLDELAAHMEMVTQKYLRNEYATLGAYNAAAGEVAEPYRVLVVADFPAGFDERSAIRLAAIASGGVPCGVLTLAAVDPGKPFPGGVAVSDLRPHATRLVWEGDRLARDDPDFGRFPLEPDRAPPADLATRLAHRVGASAREARRVAVPFEYIAPAEGAWWAADSRAGVDVPLGKAGATKRQHLALGQGTSQHVLIAGRTGSGKSTLLHALIVNLALNYSPDEVELYLIDFKKGVEFKVYAAQGLPHAGVVAVESEREFGVSVLQRLDAEMKARGERFRAAGVSDLHGFRDAPGSPPLPRVVLVVDEFQEFFVEDDKLAHEAALLLDRLVRQGRAFGIHAVLGSQSLGGAYALARSTLGQMAVRVALQCSDSDAHLILSEQNTAAKLLSRPGEAVYNDANGVPEGNHFFQVVWLGDDRREDYLRRLRDLARARPPALRRTPVVFEGDAPADPSRNPKLVERLDAPGWPDAPRSAHAWLGEAVAIKDPTSALFRRQGGNHLLVVGQDGEAALGVLASALLSLAAQFRPPGPDGGRSGARFAVLDGTPEDDPRAGFLARVAGAVPHPVEAGTWNDAARVLAGIAGEVGRRQQPGGDGPEVFVFVHDLPRFRDLRKRADDFSFSRREDEDAGPADHLATVLREGPGVGVHVLTWCDTLNNLNRVFDHQALREFEMRVLFQMSPNDSGHLLDSPQAGKLGPNRAYFASEEQNRLEKFRPYGPPADDWLAHAAARLRAKAGG